VGALAALPLAASRVNPSPAPPIEPSANVAYLAEQTPAGRAIMTNGPWLVAWYGDRPAVWLVQEAGELPLLEKKTGQPLSYLYFSRYRGRLGAEEIADWWLAARQSPLGCETFLPHPSRAAGEVVLKRYGGLQDGALEAGEKWLADYPNHPVALNNLACLYAEKGRNLDRALALARRAVKASPENAATWDTLGWICYRAGRSQEALEPLREAVRRRPDRGLYYYHLGKALLARGHRREAAQSLRTGLSRGLPPAEKKDAESSLRAGASGP
jgi:predicted Zn-dependent protease